MAHRLFQATLLWTLALLLLGSIVHATESSLACPDWPTCFGTMTPEMTGGVFWEHLHRLWAGGLVLLYSGATAVFWRTVSGRSRLRWLALGGIALLLIQSVLGGLTVIYQLPDAISTSHLTLAFLFLGLLTALTTVTSRGWADRPAEGSPLSSRPGLLVAALVLGQSVVGALVRHTDSGVACPDVPLCLGRLVPPLDHWMVALHFTHRLLGLIVVVVTAAVAVQVLRMGAGRVPRRFALGLLFTVGAQFVLGFLSVVYQLQPALVALHTLGAALLLSLAVGLATWGWKPPAGRGFGGREPGSYQTHAPAVRP
ncbi:MAG: heme A synthase [Gemmatimonadetes bacterium]|nr:heme A synthase [Gemmatimonadota bacterium]